MSSGLTLKNVSSYFWVLFVDFEHPSGEKPIQSRQLRQYKNIHGPDSNVFILNSKVITC